MILVNVDDQLREMTEDELFTHSQQVWDALPYREQRVALRGAWKLAQETLLHEQWSMDYYDDHGIVRTEAPQHDFWRRDRRHTISLPFYTFTEESHPERWHQRTSFSTVARHTANRLYGWPEPRLNRVLGWIGVSHVPPRGWGELTSCTTWGRMATKMVQRVVRMSSGTPGGQDFQHVINECHPLTQRLDDVMVRAIHHTQWQTVPRVLDSWKWTHRDDYHLVHRQGSWAVWGVTTLHKRSRWNPQSHRRAVLTDGWMQLRWLVHLPSVLRGDGGIFAVPDTITSVEEALDRFLPSSVMFDILQNRIWYGIGPQEIWIPAPRFRVPAPLIRQLSLSSLEAVLDRLPYWQPDTRTLTLLHDEWGRRRPVPRVMVAPDHVRNVSAYAVPRIHRVRIFKTKPEVTNAHSAT